MSIISVALPKSSSATLELTVHSPLADLNQSRSAA